TEQRFQLAKLTVAVGLGHHHTHLFAGVVVEPDLHRGFAGLLGGYHDFLVLQHGGADDFHIAYRDALDPWRFQNANVAVVEHDCIGQLGGMTGTAQAQGAEDAEYALFFHDCPSKNFLYGGHVPRRGTLRFGLFQAQRLNRNHAIAAGASGNELDHSIGFALRRAAVARSLQADGDAAVENVAIGVDHLAVHQAADQLAVRAIHAVATQGADNVALGITDDLHDVLLHIEAGAFDGLAAAIDGLAVLDRTDGAALRIDDLVSDNRADHIAVGVTHHLGRIGQRFAIGAEQGLFDLAKHLAAGIEHLAVLDGAEHLAVGIDQLAVLDCAEDLAVGTADHFAHLPDQIAVGIEQGGAQGAEHLTVQTDGLAVPDMADEYALGILDLVAIDEADDLAVGITDHRAFVSLRRCSGLHLRAEHVDDLTAGIQGHVLLDAAQALAVQADGLAVFIFADDLTVAIDHLAVDHLADHVTGLVADHGGLFAHAQQRIVGRQTADDAAHDLAVEANGLAVDDMTDDASVEPDHVVANDAAEQVAVCIEHHIDGFRRQRVEQAGDGDLVERGVARILGITQYGNQFASLLRDFNPRRLGGREHQR